MDRYRDYLQTSGLDQTNYSYLSKYFRLIDVICSFLIHGSHLDDYFLYEFYNKRYQERKKFITVRRAKKIYSISELRHRKILWDKLATAQEYSEYFGRDYFYVPQSGLSEFRMFCQNHKRCIAKPRYGGSARGICLIDIESVQDYVTLYESLKKGDYILEEVIQQHPAMGSLHPNSVNTLRINTRLVKGRVEIVAISLRIGNNNSFVDNRSAGGIVAEVDLETGIVYTTGVDKWSNRYIRHPITGERIVGFEIPNWNSVVEMVENISVINPGMKYVGWDIAITSEGAILVEGNSKAKMYVHQQSTQRGLWPQYEEWVKQSRTKGDIPENMMESE